MCTAVKEGRRSDLKKKQLQAMVGLSVAVTSVWLMNGYGESFKLLLIVHNYGDNSVTI